MKALKIFLSILLTAAPSAAAASDEARIGIRATVPTICRVDAGQSVLLQAADDYDLGQVTELCNNGGGYSVVLLHPKDLVGGQAFIDGVAVPLSASGRTVLTDSNVPAMRRRQVRLKLGENAPAVAHIGLQAIPKGFVY